MMGSKAAPDLNAGQRSAPDIDTEASDFIDQRESQEDGLSLDVVFDILKNQRRRMVLHYLINQSETSTISDLAEHIAAVENDKTQAEITSAERKRVYVCLYQCHLPKMDDAGIIDFEENRGTVVLDDDTSQFTQYLDYDDNNTLKWPKYYAGLALLGGFVFLVQRMMYPIDALSGVIMGVLIGLIFNLALEHAYQRGLLEAGGFSIRKELLPLRTN